MDMTVVPDMNGEESITITVTDGEGASVSENFKLTVHPVNDPPFLVNPIPDAIVNASYELEVPLSTILGVIFDDVDDEELNF